MNEKTLVQTIEKPHFRFFLSQRKILPTRVLEFPADCATVNRGKSIGHRVSIPQGKPIRPTDSWRVKFPNERVDRNGTSFPVSIGRENEKRGEGNSNGSTMVFAFRCVAGTNGAESF